MNKERKSMIIVGAGLGGLSTACYAQMNGYQSKIFEMHSLAGGCCTSWKRKEFIFDFCICWMLGTGRDNEMNQIWMELGALQGKKVHDFDIFNSVVGLNGETVHFYVEPDRLEAHLLEISPEDSDLIKRFCKDMRLFRKAVNVYPFLKPVGLMSFWEKFNMYRKFLPYMRTVMKSHNILMKDFAAKFKHPFLREAMNYIFYDKHPYFPLLPFYFNVASAANQNAGCPEGGSMGVARSIEENYYRLGGEIQYNAKVESILVEDDRAIGIRLADGSEHFADMVISASDLKFTVQKMLKDRYTNPTLKHLFEKKIDEPEMIYTGWTTVFLGLNYDLSNEFHSISYLLTEEEAKQLPGVLHSNISFQIRSNVYDKLCPPGKSVVFASFFSDYDYWANLSPESPEMMKKVPTARKRTPKYQAAKQKAANFIISYLDQKYPGLKEKVEYTDVSTPLTLVRYTGNYKGSVLAWNPFGEAGETLEKYIEENGPVLPGLKNFYLSGTWISTGGVIRAVTAGRHVMQFICKDDNKKFHACIPEVPQTIAAPHFTTEVAEVKKAKRELDKVAV